MCGVVGFADYKKQASLNLLNKLVNKLSHRGPDDYGSYFDESKLSYIGLGHSRLSILDPTQKGKQPMIFKEIVISYNGEIYNFLELKNELKKIGYEFETRTDTEVLLKAYHCWGIEFIHKLNGMFVISLLDKKKEKFYLIRDRLGIKPIYWFFDDETFIFSSELKVFKSIAFIKKKISMDGLSCYFRYGYIPEPYSILEGVKKLAAGSFLEFSIIKKNFTINKYWDLNNKKFGMDNSSEENVLNKLDSLIRDSVKLRMISDFPVGIFLSGGYDSSLVASYMTELSNKPVESFTIGFKNKLFDESVHAQKISNFLKTNHHEFIIDNEDVLDIFKEYKNLYDEPFGDPSFLPTAFLSKKTKSIVKVVQSADGGDELFIGYDKYRKILKRYKKSKLIPSFLKKFLKIILNEDLLTNKKNSSYINNENLNDWLIDESKVNTNDQLNKLLINPRFSKTNFYNYSLFNDDLNEMLYLDVKTFLLDDILWKVDRATMYSGLEARDPLLDFRLVEYALNIPAKTKLKNNQLKYLLKQLAHKKIPKKLLDRPKQGFNLPIVDLALTFYREYKDVLLKESTIMEQNLFNVNEIQKLKYEIDNKKYKNIGNLWLLLIFQIWYYDFYAL